MPVPQSPTAAERFATTLQCLSLSVAGRAGIGWFTLKLIAVIVGRLRGIKQRFARIAARVGAGTYVPRRRAAGVRHQPAARPRTPDPLPQKPGWLLEVPDAAGYRAQLEYLFADAEMAALLAAAPGPLRRPLRSLCRMLGMQPPPVLAPPANPRPKPQRPARQPKPPPVSAGSLPLWLRPPPGQKLWLPPGIRGPKRPA